MCAAVDCGVDEGVLVENRESWAFFCEDLSDSCCEDHFDISEVSQDHTDWPEPCVGLWGPGLVELLIGKLEDSWIDGFDPDAEACDEFFDRKLLECSD